MMNEKPAKSLISPVKTVVLVVKNLDAARIIFEAAIGLQCVGETVADFGETDRFGGNPKGSFRIARFARSDGNDFGCLDLVENKAAQNPLRSPQRPFDFGIFTLNFRTNDLERAIEILSGRGARAVSRPLSYNVGKPLREVMFDLPAGERLTVLQLGDTNRELPVFTEPVATYGLIVPSMRGALCFYGDALGLETAITFQHKGPPFDELLGISDEMSMDFATLTSDGQWMGKVELLQLEVAGQKPEDTSVKADFAHTGYALLTFLTRDIESAKHACERAGATIVVEPAQFNRPFHENSRVMIVRSPGGEYLEIIEEDYSGG